MKKNILSMFIAMMMVVLSAMPVFAEETQTQKKDVQIKNEIVGKITSINENYVNIDVATPKKIEKPERGEKPEKSENKEVKKEDANSFKPEDNKNIEDMFTLTGEKKTINIKQAKFMGQVRIMNENKNSSNDTNKTNNTDNSNNIKNQEKEKELTYTDFAVGDYIRIVLADDGSNVAKVVMKGGIFRNKPERQAGNKPNKKPDNKQEN